MKNLIFYRLKTHIANGSSNGLTNYILYDARGDNILRCVCMLDDETLMITIFPGLRKMFLKCDALL